jgi:hypothetical protein
VNPARRRLLSALPGLSGRAMSLGAGPALAGLLPADAQAGVIVGMGGYA